MFCRLRILMAEQEPPLNQTQLVKATGLGNHTVSKLYNNTFTRIDKNTVETLLNYFECKLVDLLIEREVDAND